MRVLVFETGNSKYALETNHVHAIILGGHENVSLLNGGSELVEGLIEIEGRTSAVINIAALFPIRNTKEDNSSRKSKQLIVYDLEGELVVFKVSGVEDSISINPDNIESVDSCGPLRFMKGIVHINKQAIPLLDPTQILQSV